MLGADGQAPPSEARRVGAERHAPSILERLDRHAAPLLAVPARMLQWASLVAVRSVGLLHASACHEHCMPSSYIHSAEHCLAAVRLKRHT